MPKPRKYERFGKEEMTYDLVGRIHLDYLQLYKKYNYESRHSYKLDFIGEMEVGEQKVPYEGTLDQLYNRDFKKFIEYNQQDVLLLVKIHRKLRFLELANALAHENTVLLQTVMGSVAMIEMAIYNEAHSRGMVIPSKKKQESTGQAAGAYVAVPHKGIHEWIAICDLNSLYPSTIRALNMSPETIVGQLRQTLTNAYLEKKSIELGLAKSKSKKHVDIDSDDSEDGDDYKFDSKTKRVTGPILWENMFGSVEYTEVMNRTDTKIWIDFENGESIELHAHEIYDLIFNEKSLWGLSANGTIFTFEFEGVIPGLLTRWYSERKDLQKKSKNAKDQKEYEYYDKRQLVRKILLNSALTHTWRPYIATFITVSFSIKSG
jgi:DNA polymerase elongation subunit (family B)